MEWNNKKIISPKTCSVFGHRQIEVTDNLQNKLTVLFRVMIEKYNVTTFYFGGFGEFDNFCHKIVSDLKARYPHIQRIFCTADPRWLRPIKRPLWLNKENYEDVVYLDLKFDWWYTRIYYRNCEMIDQSDYVVFYVTDKSSNSGAYKAMQYAQKKKKEHFNLVEMW